jgi:hypothetical protein
MLCAESSFKLFSDLLERVFCVFARNKAVSVACRRPSSFSLLAHATAGAVANGEAGPKGAGQDARSQEKEPREMAGFDTPELRAGRVEDFGSTHGDTTCRTATPRRI